MRIFGPKLFARIAFGIGSLAVLLRADWVDLVDGTSLRGLDLKEDGDRFSFTTEEGKVIGLQKAQIVSTRKSEPGEKLEFRGREVALLEKIRVLQSEEGKRRKEAIAWLEKWAADKTGGGEAKAKFNGQPADEKERALVEALLHSKFRKARELAAGELSGNKSRLAVGALAHAAITDSNGAVREKSLRTFEAVKDENSPNIFIPYLVSPQTEQRTRASLFLEAFPTRRAVPVLIESMHLAWTDFGRSMFFQGEVRKYISDYSLTSGGTGFSIIEVADPDVSSLNTGVVLDVKVQKVEMEARRRALRKITGQDFGSDVGKWRQWWKENNASAK